jgi:hypothetical protein
MCFVRVRFFVDGLTVADGFNVYHALRQAVRDRSRQPGEGVSTAGAKWFDLPRYCRDFVRNVLPAGASLQGIEYFPLRNSVDPLLGLMLKAAPTQRGRPP